MSKTFLIKDILSGDAQQVVDYKRSSVSPVRLAKKPRIDTTSPQQQVSANPTEAFMSSLLAAAANQQYQQQQYSSLYLTESGIADQQLSMKSPQSYSSSSSSLSSTSPISTSSSTASSQFSHEQLVNQFYQRLLFLNLQNSLSRIQQQSSQSSDGFHPYSYKQPSNKEHDESESSEYDAPVHSSSDTDIIDIRHQKHKSTRNKKNSNLINKSFSTSSLKTNDELDESNSENGHCSTPLDKNTSNNISNVSPLDALLQMANTTFVQQNSHISNSNQMLVNHHHHHIHHQYSLQDKSPKVTAVVASPAVTAPSSIIDIITNTATTPQSVLSNKLNQSTVSVDSLSKRKRKNRTAFTAHQIYELEKRFAAQKYLSPSDRDRISQELSLSTAQVITWFQNRRAKQKRDVEEMKNDLMASKSLCAQSSNDDQLSSCSYSNQHQGLYQHKTYNDSLENDCTSQCESDISLGSPNTSMS